MSNLGGYQDFATAAKRAGGVDNFIAAIEKDAVTKAFPKIFGAGLLVAGAVASTAVAVAKRYSGLRDLREAQANEAREQIKAEVEASAKPVVTDLETGEEDDGPDAGPKR